MHEEPVTGQMQFSRAKTGVYIRGALASGFAGILCVMAKKKDFHDPEMLIGLSEILDCDKIDYKKLQRNEGLNGR